MKTARDLLFLRVNIIYSLYFLSAVTGKQKVYIARQKEIIQDDITRTLAAHAHAPTSPSSLGLA